MLHPSTKALIDRIADMSAQGKIRWEEGQNGAFRFAATGYSVEVSVNPPELDIRTPDGRLIEQADAGELRDVPHETFGDYSRLIQGLHADIRRTLNGVPQVIATILEGLDLNGDGVADVVSITQVVAEPLDDTPIPEVEGSVTEATPYEPVQAEDVAETQLAEPETVDPVADSADADIEPLPAEESISVSVEPSIAASDTLSAPEASADISEAPLPLEAEVEAISSEPVSDLVHADEALTGAGAIEALPEPELLHEAFAEPVEEAIDVPVVELPMADGTDDAAQVVSEDHDSTLDVRVMDEALPETVAEAAVRSDVPNSDDVARAVQAMVMSLGGVAAAAPAAMAETVTETATPAEDGAFAYAPTVTQPAIETEGAAVTQLEPTRDDATDILPLAEPIADAELDTPAFDESLIAVVNETASDTAELLTDSAAAMESLAAFETGETFDTLSIEPIASEEATIVAIPDEAIAMLDVPADAADAADAQATEPSTALGEVLQGLQEGASEQIVALTESMPTASGSEVQPFAPAAQAVLDELVGTVPQTTGLGDAQVVIEHEPLAEAEFVTLATAEAELAGPDDVADETIIAPSFEADTFAPAETVEVREPAVEAVGASDAAERSDEKDHEKPALGFLGGMVNAMRETADRITSREEAERGNEDAAPEPKREDKPGGRFNPWM